MRRCFWPPIPWLGTSPARTSSSPVGWRDGAFGPRKRWIRRSPEEELPEPPPRLFAAGVGILLLDFPLSGRPAVPECPVADCQRINLCQRLQTFFRRGLVEYQEALSEFRYAG